MQIIKEYQFKLYQLGYLLSTQVDGIKGPITTSAIKSFQKDNKLEVTGEMDVKTKTKLFDVADRFQTDYTPPKNSQGSNEVADEMPNGTVSPKDESVVEAESDPAFFDTSSFLRKLNVPIVIKYGPNDSFQKRITNVHFRSLGQQLDGSGNPIYDTIEFIGRDIEEE